MMSPLKVFALLLGLTLGGVSFAQSTATVDQYCFNNNGGSCQGTWQTSPAAACAEGAQYYSTLNAPQTCTVSACSGKSGSPANRFSCTLTAGYVYNNGLSYRSAPGSLPCPSAGTEKSINFTLGFTHDPSGDTSATGLDIPGTYMAARSAGSVCASGGGSVCSVQIDTATPPSAVWISASPNAQGLYRVSVDQRVTYTGTSCTQTANEKTLTESTDAGPACDGAFGVVNGRSVCVPSDLSSRNTVQGTTGTTTVPRQVGNPAAGSNAGLPVGSRTPSGGSGNNDGGPVTPLDGSPAPLNQPLPNSPVGSVTGEINVEVETCGIPGKPPCKIDETGTPGPEAAASATSADGLNSVFDGATDQLGIVTSPQGKDTSWGVTPSWFESTTCAPFNLGTLPAPINREITFDICPVIPYVNGVMNFLWVVVTFFAIVSMTFRVMTSAKA